MLNKKARVHALKILTADVQKEMKFLCSKRVNSLLRATSEKKLTTFTWDKLAEELEEKAPTFFAILTACVSVRRRERAGTKRPNSRCVSDTTALGVCAGILLRHSNHHMNLIQRMVALILDSGHSGKEVLLYYTKLIISMTMCVHAGLHQAAKNASQLVPSKNTCLS